MAGDVALRRCVTHPPTVFALVRRHRGGRALRRGSTRGRDANGAVTGAFSRAFNDEHAAAAKVKVDRDKVGLELTKGFLRANVDSSGNRSFSLDLDAVTFTVDESGRVQVSAGMADAALKIGEGLTAAGLNVAGTTFTISNLQNLGRGDVTWTISTPDSILGINLPWNQTWSGTFNPDPVAQVRDEGIGWMINGGATQRRMRDAGL